MFAYCLNNPVNNVDSTGMRPVDIKLARHVGEGGSGGPQPASVSPIVNIVEAIKNVVDYVTNDDEQNVLKAEHIAFYKGTPVVKVPWMDGNALSFGAIFMASNIKDSPNLVKHEYGHILQLNQVGFATYTSMVAVPSLIGYGLTEANILPDELYYNLPWERSADYLGNANRSYMSWANTVGSIYWGIASVVGHFMH